MMVMSTRMEDELAMTSISSMLILAGNTPAALDTAFVSRACLSASKSTAVIGSATANRTRHKPQAAAPSSEYVPDEHTDRR